MDPSKQKGQKQRAPKQKAHTMPMIFGSRTPKPKSLFSTPEQKELVRSTLARSLTVEEEGDDDDEFFPASESLSDSEGGSSPTTTRNARAVHTYESRVGTVPSPSSAYAERPAASGDPSVSHKAFYGLKSTGGLPSHASYISSSHNAAGTVLPLNQTLRYAEVHTAKGAKVDVQVHSRNGRPGKAQRRNQADGRGDDSIGLMTMPDGTVVVDESFVGARLQASQQLTIHHCVGNGI